MEMIEFHLQFLMNTLKKYFRETDIPSFTLLMYYYTKYVSTYFPLPLDSSDKAIKIY